MFRSISEWIFGPRKVEAADEASLGVMLATGRCPDCKSTAGFFEGPSGGMSVNIMCESCGHEFNFCPAIPEMTHRNSSEFHPARNSAFRLPADWRPLLERK